MEKIVHTAKQTVKATVESHKARAWSARLMVVLLFMDRSPSSIANRLERAEYIGRNVPTLMRINRSRGRSVFGIAEFGL
jgi:hypothetical protein